MPVIALRQLLDYAAEHGYGVPAFNVNNLEQTQAIVQAAVATDSPVIHGVRKINIDTDVRLAMTGAMRRSMAKDKSEFDPRKFLKEATAAARDICMRCEAFGTGGKPARSSRSRWRSWRSVALRENWMRW
jgi:fructose/tagatose bisphosphate aldolase